MNENMRTVARQNFEAHRGKQMPILVVCVDKKDAQARGSRHTITIADLARVGVKHLKNQLALSVKAEELLYR